MPPRPSPLSSSSNDDDAGPAKKKTKLDVDTEAQPTLDISAQSEAPRMLPTLLGPSLCHCTERDRSETVRVETMSSTGEALNAIAYSESAGLTKFADETIGEQQHGASTIKQCTFAIGSALLPPEEDLVEEVSAGSAGIADRTIGSQIASSSKLLGSPAESVRNPIAGKTACYLRTSTSKGTTVQSRPLSELSIERLRRKLVPCASLVPVGRPICGISSPYQVATMMRGVFAVLQVMNQKGYFYGHFDLGSVITLDDDVEISFIDFGATRRHDLPSGCLVPENSQDSSAPLRLAEDDTRSNSEYFTSMNTDAVREQRNHLVYVELKLAKGQNETVWRAKMNKIQTKLEGPLQHRSLDDAQSAYYLLVWVMHSMSCTEEHSGRKAVPAWTNYLLDKAKLVQEDSTVFLDAHIHFKNLILQSKVLNLLDAIASCVSSNVRSEMVHSQSDQYTGRLSPLDWAMFRGIDQAFKTFLYEVLKAIKAGQLDRPDDAVLKSMEHALSVLELRLKLEV